MDKKSGRDGPDDKNWIFFHCLEKNKNKINFFFTTPNKSIWASFTMRYYVFLCHFQGCRNWGARGGRSVNPFPPRGGGRFCLPCTTGTPNFFSPSGITDFIIRLIRQMALEQILFFLEVTCELRLVLDGFGSK